MNSDLRSSRAGTRRPSRFMGPAAGGLALRAARPADYETVASWIPDAMACLRWAGPGVPFPFAAHDLRAVLAHPDGRDVCLVGPEDVVCAFGQCRPTVPHTMHLARLIVAPDRRGRGLGEALCAGLMRLAAQTMLADTVTLRVYRDNRHAVALYERLGFTVVDDRSSAEVLFMSSPVALDPDESG